MRDFYNTNKDFKTYVDKCCAMYGKTVDEALELALVKEVAEAYGKSGKAINGSNTEQSVYSVMGECK